MILRGIDDRPGPHDLAVERQDAGIEGVGLGQQIHRAGEVADGPWIDQRDRQSRVEQRVQERSFIAAGGFDDDEFGLGILEPGDQP